jgi:hypothetical protein
MNANIPGDTNINSKIMWQQIDGTLVTIIID